TRARWYKLRRPRAPATARGNERIRPMSAAERPSSSVSGPIDTRSDEPCSVAYRMIEIAERNPAMLQIAVDISFGLMPVSRARSEFVADARTETPKRL